MIRAALNTPFRGPLANDARKIVNYFFTALHARCLGDPLVVPVVS